MFFIVLVKMEDHAIGTALSRDRSEVTLFLIMDIFAVPVQYFLKAFKDMGDLCLHLVGGDSLIHKTGDARQIRSHLLMIVGIQFFQSSVFFF